MGFRTIRFRRGTTAQAAASARVLEAGEPAYTTDTGKLQIGDGVTPLATLPAFLNESAVAATIVGTAKARVTPYHIDLCAAPHNVVPGDDVTVKLQAAINALVATGKGGVVTFSTPGEYLIGGALQTGTALGYNYSGQILFPATPYTSQPVIPVVIKGPHRVNGGLTPWNGGSGDATSTGAPNGLILKSTGTSGGYVFDTVPGQMGWGKPWTGVMPIFQDVIVRSPSNPTNGGINLNCALRCELDKIIIDTYTSWLVPTAATNVTALVLPDHFNNGDILVHGEIHGYDRAIKLSEHAHFPKLDISNCNVGFYSDSGGHDNYFGYVDLEEVTTLFEVATGAALFVHGHIDFENTRTTGTPQRLAKLNGTGSFLTGSLSINLDPATPLGTDASILGQSAGGMGIITPAGSTCALALENLANFTARSSATHPIDTFRRLNNMTLTSADGAPGLSWPTLHPWRTNGTDWQIVAGKLSTPTAGMKTAMLPAIGQGVPREVHARIATHSNPVLGVQASRVYSDGTRLLWAGFVGATTLKFGLGIVNNGGILRTVTIPNVASRTVDLSMQIYYRDGSPRFVRVLVDGVAYVNYTLSDAEVANIAPGDTAPYLEDGLYCGDYNFGTPANTSSSVLRFEVKSLGTQPFALKSGTATLVAGTVAVADVNITSTSVVRLNRQTAGGALGQLSVVLTAGTGFTINSSAAETSTVYYEVVSY